MQSAASTRLLRRLDLGPDVRLTLRIRLVNAGDDKLFITGLSLLQFGRPGRNAAGSPSIILDPHGSSDITQQFTIPRDEYERWRRGLRP